MPTPCRSAKHALLNAADLGVPRDELVEETVAARVAKPKSLLWTSGQLGSHLERNINRFMGSIPGSNIQILHAGHVRVGLQAG